MVKRYSHILYYLLLILAVIYSFYLLFFNSRGANSSQPDTQIGTWKTYTNTTFKYKIKYPPTWNVDASSHILNEGVNFYSPDFRISSDSGFPEYGAAISVEARKTDQKNLEDLYQQIMAGQYQKVHTKQEKNLGGQKALYVETSGLEEPDTTTTSTIKDGIEYHISFYEYDTQYGPIYQKMLSGFEFIP